ncbi:hypothetical protein ASD86_09210 [Lysobacter sp. Root690]|nr:hypothetical protein ASD86_09210 [Lysobacter sp. Root690]
MRLAEAASRLGLIQALGGRIEKTMALMDIVEIGEALLSWRFYVGTAVTAALCWLVFTCIPNETVAWVIAAPLGTAD